MRFSVGKFAKSTILPNPKKTIMDIIDTHGCISLTTLLVKDYNDLIDEVLNGAGMKSHTSLLGTLFVCQFSIKNPPGLPETSGEKFQTFH